MNRRQQDFFRSALGLLDRHLEKDRLRLSILVSGGAFESWLAFETRLLFEKHRRPLRLGPREDRWIATEWTKTDLAIGGLGGNSGCHSIFEFKVVYNNKNWTAQIDGVLRDLHPAAKSKKGKLAPKLGRIVVAVVIGKLYREKWADGYPQPQRRFEAWVKDLRTRLKEKGVRVVWEGTRHLVTHPYLKDKPTPFLQILGLMPAGT